MCEYCEFGKPMMPRIVDMEGYPELVVEHGELFFDSGNDEAVFRIKHCPMCGRALAGEAVQMAGDMTNYERLFGTPERAARTVMARNDCRVISCPVCAARDVCKYQGEATGSAEELVEWLKGGAK